MKLLLICLLSSLHLLSNDLVLTKSEYKTVGEGMLEYIFWDIYQVTYMRHKENSDSELLQLTYKIDVEKKYSIQGWEEGLRNNLKEKFSDYEEQFKWLTTNTPEIKKNDKMVLLKDSKRVAIFHNKKLISASNDPKLREIVFMPWLGNVSVDDDLKNELLGK